MDKPAADAVQSAREIGVDPNGRSRLDWVDAARGIGILLVVIAHVWARGPVRDAIYAFHMPLFFLLSGYCARPRPVMEFARGQVRATVVPYCAFLLGIALADQLIEHMRGHLPIFRSWGQAARELLLGGSELDGPFTIFWFIPCLAAARLCQNALGRWWPDPRDPRWAAAMAVSLALGLWIGASTDFSPLGLVSVPAALVLLWLGALWRSMPNDRWLVGGALVIGVTVLLLAHPLPLGMKLGDYGEPLLSLPLAVILSLGVAGLARSLGRRRLTGALLMFMGRRSLVIMYCHVAFIHYAAPYLDKGALLALAVTASLLVHEGLARTRWGRRYFLGLAREPRKISYNERVAR